MNSLEFEGAPVVVAPEFGSANPGHRDLIRARLQKFVREAIVSSGQIISASETETIAAWSNLKNRPSLPGWAISISHCPNLGGFVAARNSGHVGFDIEQTARVSVKAAERVAVFPGETKHLRRLTEAAQPVAMFWVAKEAAIKAFGNSTPHSPTHFGEVEIVDFDLATQTFTGRRDQLTARGKLLPPSAFLNATTAGAVAKL